MINSVMRVLREYFIYTVLTAGVVNLLLQTIFVLYSYCILLQNVKVGILSPVMGCTGYNLLSIGGLVVAFYWLKNKSVKIEFKELICNNIKSATIGIILTAFLVNGCIIGPTERILSSVIRVEFGLILCLLAVWIHCARNDALLNYVFGITLSMVLFMSYYNISDIMWLATWEKIVTIIMVKTLIIGSFRFISECMASWLSVG